MSTFKVEIVRIGAIDKHPNADTLSTTKAWDYPVIIKTGEFKTGDLAAYVPVDAVVPSFAPEGGASEGKPSPTPEGGASEGRPSSTPEGDRFAFLGEHRRVKARRLRGIFSMGLLIAADPGWTEGQDVATLLGIVKYEQPEAMVTGGDSEPCPFPFPTYTDIEGYRRFPNVLRDGEEVVITEKIHGANGRWAFHEGRLWAGSHHGIKKNAPGVIWWRIAAANALEARLQRVPGIALFGEVYGDVQDLKYGTKKGELRLVVFDALDLSSLRYLGWDRTVAIAKSLELPTVPVLHRGPWSASLLSLASGRSTIAENIREGIVIRPAAERFDASVGRAIIKFRSPEKTCNASV